MSEPPVFLLGLQRGGTNQVLNVFRSHPDTVWPDGELQEVTRPVDLRRHGVRKFARRAARYAPVLLTRGDLLNPNRAPPADALDGWRGPWLKAVLAAETRANRSVVAAHKQPLIDRRLIRLSPDGRQRMIVKLVNYNVGLAPALARIYPGASFVGIIRNPIAICEGRISREAALEEAAAACTFVAQAFDALQIAGANITVFRFEDLLSNAETTIRRMLEVTGLSLDRIEGVCLQDKLRLVDKSSKIVGLGKTDLYYTFEEVDRHFRKDANDVSASRLSESQRREIRRLCADLMARYGYD